MMRTFQKGAAEQIAEYYVKEGKNGSEHPNGLASGRNFMRLTGTYQSDGDAQSFDFHGTDAIVRIGLAILTKVIPSPGESKAEVIRNIKNYFLIVV